MPPTFAQADTARIRSIGRRCPPGSCRETESSKRSVVGEIGIFQQLPLSHNIQWKYVHALLGGYAFKFLHE